MYYDDEARRFNFLSGLVFGAVLGAGLALLVAPQKRVPIAGTRGKRSRAWQRVKAAGLDQLRGGVLDAVGEALAAGRGPFRR